MNPGLRVAAPGLMTTLQDLGRKGYQRLGIPVSGALDAVSLDFREGQLTSLLGPSGCGKTTLLKIVAGLIPATGGEVRIKGRSVGGPGPERSFVFQDFALLPWATVLRNAAFGLELRGVPRSQREAIASAQISGQALLAG